MNLIAFCMRYWILILVFICCLILKFTFFLITNYITSYVSFSQRVKLIKEFKVEKGISSKMIARIMVGMSKEDCVSIIKKSQELAEKDGVLINLDNFIMAYYDTKFGYHRKDFLVADDVKNK